MIYIRKYRAKEINGEDWVIGAYFQMPKMNTKCLSSLIEEDYTFDDKKNIGHYIIHYTEGKCNEPNNIEITEVDPITVRATDEEWKI